MLVEQLRDGLQAVVLWLGQLKRLLASLVQLVDEDSAKSGLRTCVIAAGAGEGEDHFAGKVRDSQDDGMIGYSPGEQWREEQDPHVRGAVGPVVMAEVGGGPSDPGRRGDRRTSFCVGGQDATGGGHQVATCMGLLRARTTGAPQMDATGRPQPRRLRDVAADGHSSASYRQPATSPPVQGEPSLT